MKLITKEIENKKKKFPIGAQDGKGDEAEIFVKFFAPWGNWTWYAIEGNHLPNGDIEFFGLVVGDFAEMGYFYLSELEEVRGPWGLKVERDNYFKGTLKDAKRLLHNHCISLMWE